MRRGTAQYHSKSDSLPPTAEYTIQQIHISYEIFHTTSSLTRLIDRVNQIHSPRLSYLPFLLPRLHGVFAPVLIDPSTPSQDGWFSFEGVPLKWHYPIGLLYDLFSSASPSQAPRQRGRDESHADESQPLPWRLTLHFTEWPADQLVRLDAEGKVLHDAFINSVKEADFLRNGTAKGIMSLSKNDSKQLWKAVQDRMFDVELFY